MAKEANDSFLLLGCKFLQAQLDSLTTRIKGVRETGNAEYMHQARVVSRRLRSSLGFFGQMFGQKKLTRWQKQIKNLTQGLGQARDVDVQILYIETILKELTPDQKREYSKGIKRLLLRLQQNRLAIQPNVLAVLDELEACGILTEIGQTLDKRLKQLHNRNVKIKSRYVFEQAQDRIQQRIAELFSWEPTLDDPNNITGHHQMRIAAKQLRYTLEICDKAFGKRLKPFITQFKEIQTLLGDVHDCDVWLERINAFIPDEQQRAVQYFGDDQQFEPLQPGLEYVRQSRQEKRKELFGRLIVLWKQMKEQGFWEQLSGVLTNAVEAAKL